MDTIYFIKNWKLIVENIITKYFLKDKILFTHFSSVGWSINSALEPAKNKKKTQNVETFLGKCTLKLGFRPLIGLVQEQDFLSNAYESSFHINFQNDL